MKSYILFLFLILNQTACYLNARISDSIISQEVSSDLQNQSPVPGAAPAPVDSTNPFVLVKKVIGQSARNTCVIYNSSSMGKCAGSNYNSTDGTYGLLGINSSTNAVRNTFASLADDGLFVSISMGEYAGCGIKPDQSIKCWGRWVGDGSTGDRYLPTAISDTGKFIDVAVGSYHACAINETGDMKCWGDGWDGKLGTGNNSFQASPTAVSSTSKFIKVSAGRNHTCGITSNKKIECWGNNSAGQLGDGTFTSPRLSPVNPIDSGETYLDVSCGEDTTCAITSSNVLKCWGNNGSGQVGVGNTTNVNIPTTIGGTMTYSKVGVASSGFHTCAITTSGGLQCWGSNISGQLGIGNTTSQSSPNVVSMPGVAFKEVVTGGYASCASSVDNKLYCWGSNGFSQLGQGAVGNQLVPAVSEANFN